MKKLVRGFSETRFINEKNKIELLNNNLKLLKNPIKNKEYQTKRRISNRLVPKPRESKGLLRII